MEKPLKNAPLSTGAGSEEDSTLQPILGCDKGEKQSATSFETKTKKEPRVKGARKDEDLEESEKGFVLVLDREDDTNTIPRYCQWKPVTARLTSSSNPSQFSTFV